MGKMKRITVDGRVLETDRDLMLLELLSENGIEVPHLCSHPSLAPSGACRLCVVEITKKEWQGKSKIVTSCLYPVEDGLVVSTRSSEVLRTRRGLLELYLAQCPESELIREMARAEGIETTPFATVSEENRCILCGLCARVCQDYGPGAIATLARGPEKHIGPSPEGMAEDCVGCRACAYLCPTGAIPVKQEDQLLKIWKRSFEIPVCSVQPELCRGCGICEEVCPFNVPRVILLPNGLTVSRISPEACTGCGICAGSCPAGAIKQKKSHMLDDFEGQLPQVPLKDQTVVFACPRSPMPADTEGIMIRVSCIGRVDISTLLYCLAAGAKAVALMCRDPLTCPFHQGSELGQSKISTAGALLELCGLEKERLAFLKSYPGQEGPYRAWREFASGWQDKPSALDSIYIPAAGLGHGMDLALDLVRWFKERPALKPVLPQEIQSLFEQEADSTTILYLERLPELHLLLTQTMDEAAVLEILKEASRLLQKLNIKVRCAVSPKELQQGRVERIIGFTPPEGSSSPAGIAYCTINELAGVKTDLEAEAPFAFRLNAKQRKELMENHQQVEAQLCATPEQHLQYALLLRRGAWRQSLLKTPAMRFAAALPDSEPQQMEREPYRVTAHPILQPQARPKLKFMFNGQELTAFEGEVISSALYAAGIAVFGHHHKDGAAQGIFCANGQCSQCMVLADGKPVKACMTPVKEGMQVQSMEALPALTDDAPMEKLRVEPPETVVDVLIVGGGPAGICAAVELGSVGVEVLLVDDKQELGGKLSLQTHNFFGSVTGCYAGTRGVQIGRILAERLEKLPSVKTWLNATVIGVFNDGVFGVSKNGAYRLVRPKQVLFATGAREKTLTFPGCDLPGVYGAGAFQTLANRDLVRCAERLFIIGGGNVGLIGAYHALQAGIDVVGLVEALPRCGGYKVHEDKIKRLGVPVWTSHTVLRVEGKEKVERIVIAAVDDHFKPVPGTERSFEVDTVLVAVGLSPVNELLEKAKEYGIKTYAAGDAEEIAEASAAIFSGKITGRKMAQDLGIDLPIPGDWEAFGTLLKHRPGESKPFIPEEREAPVFPLIRCMQEIPCNPCTEACPQNCITMEGSILSLPRFAGECIGCGRCVLVCPGLAITLVINDYDPDKKKGLLMLPFEFNDEAIPLGQEVVTTDMEGNPVGKGRVVAYKDREKQDKRRLLLLEVPYEDRLKVAGFRIREVEEGVPLAALSGDAEEDPIVCRCERVRKSEIVREIRAGVRDMNQLKALLRTGLGACNGKTCTELILRIFKEEGVPLSEVTLPTHRPLVAEVHLGDFVAEEKGESK